MNEIQEKFILRMIINGVRDEIIADDRGISLQDVRDIKRRNKDFIRSERNRMIKESTKEHSQSSWKDSDKQRNRDIINKLIDLGYVGREIDYDKFKKLYEEYGDNMSETRFASTILGVTSNQFRRCKLHNSRITILGLYKPKRKALSTNIPKKSKFDRKVKKNSIENDNNNMLMSIPSYEMQDIATQENDFEDNNLVYSTMSNSALYKIRQNIAMDREYDKDELERIINDTKSDNIIEKDRTSVEAIVDVYLQLNQFGEAKQFVNEIYDEEEYKDQAKPILKIIENQEKIYNVMILYRNGMNAEDISKNSNISISDVKQIIKIQQRLDEMIIKLYDSRISTEMIVNKLNVNVKRINDALSSRKISNNNLCKGYSDGPEDR